MSKANEIIEELDALVESIDEGVDFKNSSGSKKANDLLAKTFQKRLYALNPGLKNWPHNISIMLDDPKSKEKPLYGNILIKYPAENWNALPNPFGYDAIEALQTSLGELKKVLVAPKYNTFREFKGMGKDPYKIAHQVSFEYSGEA